jgi:hypothetical protein
MSISHTLIDKSVDGGVTEPPRLDGRNINRNRALLIRWSKNPRTTSPCSNSPAD